VNKSNEISSLDQLKLILKTTEDPSSGEEIIQNLFNSYEIIEPSCDASLIDELISHNHVGAFRNLPKIRITDRSLGSEQSSWRTILNDTSSNLNSPINFTNIALELLEINYEIKVRLRKEIAYLPEKTFQKSNGIDLIEDYISLDREVVFTDKKGIVHSPHSIGSGIGVIVPVIVELATSLTSLLSIEEPESHVHPRLQTALGDLLIMRSSMSFVKHEDLAFADEEEEMKYLYNESDLYDQYGQYIDYNHLSKNKSNLILETHSEHLILRILRRIRETTGGEMEDWPDLLRKACPNGIQPDGVAVLYVDPPPKGSNNGSTVIELPVTPEGGFSRPWPGGFFEEQLNELY